MVIYEVNIEFKKRSQTTPDGLVPSDVQTWLMKHVEEMLSLPGFCGAECFKQDEHFGNLSEDSCHWTVHYKLNSMEAVDAYLRDHAPRMRANAMARFQGRLKNTRRVLKKTESI